MPDITYVKHSVMLNEDAKCQINMCSNGALLEVHKQMLKKEYRRPEKSSAN
jgi:hypothetical protein